MPRTLVFVHAHPDDESLLTAGTMARAAAEGHRVVLVVVTAGEAGLAAGAPAAADLRSRRLSELRASAAALSVHRVAVLGYADSGLHAEVGAVAGGPVPFVAVPAEEAAATVAAILTEEAADVVVGYDEAGGYGHPDHVHLHTVVAAAAARAGTPRYYEATLPREPLAAAVRWVARVYPFPPEFEPAAFETAFTPRAQITTRVGVRPQLAAKRASMAAHASQATADAGADRTLAAFLRMRGPLFAALFGTEYYVRRR